MGQAFLPRDPELRAQTEDQVERAVRAAGQRVLGWRDVPIDPTAAGERARAVMPVIRQVFVAAGPAVADGDAFERVLYLIRRRLELAGPDEIYFRACRLARWC